MPKKTIKPGSIIEISWIDAPNERGIVVQRDGRSLDVLVQRGQKVRVEFVEASQVVATHGDVADLIG